MAPTKIVSGSKLIEFWHTPDSNWEVKDFYTMSFLDKPLSAIYERPLKRGPNSGWYYKCKPCSYYIQGRCKHGSNCRYLHGPNDPVVDPEHAYYYWHNNMDYIKSIQNRHFKDAPYTNPPTVQSVVSPGISSLSKSSSQKNLSEEQTKVEQKNTINNTIPGLEPPISDKKTHTTQLCADYFIGANPITNCTYFLYLKLIIYHYFAVIINDTHSTEIKQLNECAKKLNAFITTYNTVKTDDIYELVKQEIETFLSLLKQFKMESYDILQTTKAACRSCQ